MAVVKEIIIILSTKTSFNKFNKFAFKIYNCVLIFLSLAKRYCLSKSIIMIARHSVFMGSEGNIYEAFTLCCVGVGSQEWPHTASGQASQASQASPLLRPEPELINYLIKATPGY